MAIVSSYPLGTPAITDTVIGTQYIENKEPVTKQFSINDIAELMSTATLQEVLTVGNTAETPLKINVGGAVPINAIEARSTLGYAIYAESFNEDGVFAVSTNQHALHGTSEYGNGVVGQSANGYGVYAYSTNEDAVNAISINKTAVYAYSQNANAMAAYSTAGYGLYAESVNEDGVNTKSQTRHGLNTLSDSGDGVYSVSSTGHAVYARNSGLGAKATVRAENTGYIAAIEAISTSGYSVNAIMGPFSGAGINIDGYTSGNTSGHGLTAFMSTGGQCINVSNTGLGNGVQVYTTSGIGIYTYSSSNYGIYSNTAAKDGGGVWDAFSDSRVKENVIPYTKGLSEILLINPVTYDYNGLGGIKKSTGHIGIIAQEIKEVLPETVSIYSAKLNEEDEEKTDLYTFNGTALTYALINAIKELKAEIDLLKAK